MTDEQIKQNAEAYADSMKEIRGELEWCATRDDFIAGAHSRDEEIKHLEEQLHNPWISVDERLPEEDVDNISIPVVAITNNGYWFKGQYDYNNKDGFFSEGPDFLDFEIDEFVTHWMLIPELKKKE